MQRSFGFLIVAVPMLLNFGQAHGQGIDSFSIAARSSWVKTEPTPDCRPADPNLSESIHFLLLDHQTNAELEERYWRTVKQFNNQGGVQDGSSLQFSFDPSYQRLTIHEVLIRRGTNTFDRLNKDKIKLIQQERDLERHIYNGTLSAIL